jgi:hypothetical protein
MKFGITQFERLALTAHLVGLPSPNPEHGRKRLRGWDELGVTDLADSLATAATGVGVPPQAADWVDKKAMRLIDLSPDIVDHLIAGLGGQIAGIWADALTRLRERLESLRDKKYRLPEELRAK